MPLLLSPPLKTDVTLHRPCLRQQLCLETRNNSSKPRRSQSKAQSPPVIRRHPLLQHPARVGEGRLGGHKSAASSITLTSPEAEKLQDQLWGLVTPGSQKEETLPSLTQSQLLQQAVDLPQNSDDVFLASPDGKQRKKLTALWYWARMNYNTAQ